MTAEYLNISGFAYALKTKYDTAKIYSAIAEANPAYARMSKKYDFMGENFAYSVLYQPASRSYDFTVAKTNKITTKGKKFILTRAKDYSLGSIETEVLLASEGNEASLMSAMDTQANGCITALRRSLGMRTFGNGSGKIGTVESPGASTTLTLERAQDIMNFEVGQVLVFAANEASALRDSGDKLVVQSIDRDAGTMVVDKNVSEIASIADGDSIFTEGDYDSASDRNLVVGFDGWNPVTPGTLFSVVTTVDPARLAGLRYSSTTHPGLSVEEAIQLLGSRIIRNGFNADTCYMNPDRLKDFIIALGNKANYQKETVDLKNGSGQVIAKVGFDYVEVHAGGATIKCFGDASCPINTVYVQKLDSWEFKSLGECPRWVVKDHVEDDYDRIELRLAYWGNIRCLNPGANARYDF